MSDLEDRSSHVVAHLVVLSFHCLVYSQGYVVVVNYTTENCLVQA